MPIKQINVEQVKLKGNHEWYEDEVIINETLNIYGVIDGATSLDGYRGSQGETGAYLAAQIVKHVFEAELDQTMSMKALALKANARLNDEMKLANINTANLSSLWSCALASIQIKQHVIDYVQAADCMIIAKYSDGDIRVVTRDQVAVIGKQSLNLYVSTINEEGCSHSKAVALIKPKLAENRYKANKPNGYTVLNGDSQLAHFIEHGTINRNGLVAIYLMSDGLFLPSELISYEAEKWDKTIALIDKLTLSGYAHWLLEEEQQDSECIKYKRLKVSDDKTALKITF